MSGIKVTWDIGVFNPEKHFIYRSDAPISPDNLPIPLAEVGQGINEYTDLTVVDGETYHYFVAADKKGLLVPADSSIKVGAVSLGPGPQTLIAGDMTAGFFGEVSTAEFISGDDLSSEIGLTVGTSAYSDEPWLKFIFNNEILFVAKKYYRKNVSFDDLSAINVVSATTPQLFNNKYKISLLKVIDEWNVLMYNVHEQFNVWWNYTDIELEVGTPAGTWTDTAVIRGYTSINNSNSNFDSSHRGSSSGPMVWRPVLRLQL